MINKIVIVDYGTTSKVLNKIKTIEPEIIEIVKLDRDPGILSMRVIGLKKFPKIHTSLST